MSNPPETKETAAATGSPWAFRVAKVAGIPIRIHFTFLLFLAWIALVGRRQGEAMWPAFILAIFFCVLLHELGHALTAKRFEVPTRDITLYPIGGVAMLEKRPTPRQELWITLAGPAVNVVIALVLGATILAMRGSLPPFRLDLSNIGFLEGMFIANVILAVFNMIPAFPMDGGRVLRAALALQMDEAKATQIAGSVGQALAIAIGFYGLYRSDILLMLVAFFVFLGAGQEVAVTVTRSMMTGHRIADAMQIRFRPIDHGANLDQAASMLLEGSQQDFPVFAGEEFVGILTRNAIIQGLAREGASGYVAGVMNREPRTATPELPLEKTMEVFDPNDTSPIVVLQEGKVVGMLTRENLNEFLMLQEARSKSRSYGYS